MASYYVPKKNRCQNGLCMCNSICGVSSATSSSVQSSTTSSKTVATTYDSTKTVSSSIVGKGQGNARKQGSGGNSYADYLARKKGIIYCVPKEDKCQKKVCLSSYTAYVSSTGSSETYAEYLERIKCTSGCD